VNPGGISDKFYIAHKHRKRLMKQRIQKVVSALAIMLGMWMPAQGLGQGSFVVPSGAAGVNGDEAIEVPFLPGALGRPYRFQQVYGANDMPIPFGVHYITGVAFRLNALSSGSSFDTVIPEIEVRVSTTQMPVDVLQGIFSINTGPDEMVVHPRGPLHLSATFVPGANVQPFDIIIPFSTPFVYDRSHGNLLLDVINYQQSSVRRTFDAVGSNRDSVSGVSFDGLVEGTGFTQGLVTLFRYEPVPEPSATVLVGLGLIVGCFCGCGQRKPKPPSAYVPS